MCAATSILDLSSWLGGTIDTPWLDVTATISDDKTSWSLTSTKKRIMKWI